MATRLGEPGHSRPEHSQKAERRLLARDRPEGGPRRQSVDVGLAERGNVGIGDGQPQHRPCVRDIIDRHADCPGGRFQAVGRAARPLQNVTGEAEQPAAELGLDHVLGREPETVEVFDEFGAFARVGDARGFQRVEIDHPHKCVSGGLMIQGDFSCGKPK